jgi:hypothetical protein
MPVSACPPSASPSGEAGGDTGFIKVIIFFYPASSIQYPVSETLWNKRSFSKFCLFLVPACPGYEIIEARLCNGFLIQISTKSLTETEIPQVCARVADSRKY